MKTKSPLQRLALAAVLLATISFQVSRAHAQGTAFTYQGRLGDGTNPATGSYDLRFALYDAVTGGNPAGVMNTLSATGVTNGLFSVPLDFGNQFPGSSRWLEISVRTNGGGAFTTLSPRQALMPTPYAIYSGVAATAASATTAATAASFNGPLAGDVSGTQGATVVGSVGGLAAANIAQAVSAANAATSASQPNSIVKRDAAGGFSAGNISATNFTGNGLGLTYLNGAALLNGSVGAAKIADGAIGANHLAAGAVAANLNVAGQSGVPSGGVVFSVTESAALVNAGYVRIGTTTTPDSWQPRVNGTSPAARRSHAAVWTGSEMIIWGGVAGSIELNDGGRYNPAANSWTPMTTAGAPTARSEHTAVWTGTEMIVWGGVGNQDLNSSGHFLQSGGRYNPVTDSWKEMNYFNAYPFIPRTGHTAVWTGTEMIVWGGYIYNGFYYIYLNDGGRYNPANDTWTAMAGSGAPFGRYQHTAVWTGTEMIVWGGLAFILSNGGDVSVLYVNDGGRYNPVDNTWAAVSTAGAPAARGGHTAVWTGNESKEMIVWGGNNPPYGISFNDGARYNPTGDSWTPVPTTGAPATRNGHTAVWTGSEMIVWGGGSGPLNDGGRYNLAGNTWTPVNLTDAPGARTLHTAVWTGSEMIVWGGYNGSSDLTGGGRYSTAGNTWLSLTPGAPGGRYLHTAVWTGSEMIVWGGGDAGGGPVSFFNDGGRYNPAANIWSPVSLTGAPSERKAHTAVWTGDEMIVWGGYSSVTYLNDGRRYDPVDNSWTPVSLTDAPSPRKQHTAIWTGSEMIIWGGSGSSIFNNGGRYSPVNDNWTPVSTVGAPTARANHTAVWAGSEMKMIAWGGANGGSYLNDGGRYDPADDSWTAVSATGAPAARNGYTSVWTGTEMIVWGGANGGSYLNDGGRYNSAGNSWTATTITGAPSGRIGHTVVWTGTEMIVWGGGYVYNGFYYVYLNDGGRYNPVANGWTSVTTTAAPVGRIGPSAVWTGSEMIVWGGTNDSSYLNDTFCYTPPTTLFLYQLGAKPGGSAH